MTDALYFTKIITLQRPKKVSRHAGSLAQEKRKRKGNASYSPLPPGQTPPPRLITHRAAESADVEDQAKHVPNLSKGCSADVPTH